MFHVLHPIATLDRRFYEIEDWELNLIPKAATHLLFPMHDGEVGRRIVGYVVGRDEMDIHYFDVCRVESAVAVPLKRKAFARFAAKLRLEGGG